MFESLAQGFMGLTLFFTQLVAPQSERVSLSCEKIERQNAAVVLRLKTVLPLDPQVEKLVDAGVPLRLRLNVRPDKGAEKAVVRTLRHNLADDTYGFVDSLSPSELFPSKPYPMILLALHDFAVFETAVPAFASLVQADIQVLPGRLEHFNRTVDMQKLFGRGQAAVTVNLNRGK